MKVEDLSPTEARILNSIARNPEIDKERHALRADTTKGNTTRILNKFRSRSLVVKGVMDNDIEWVCTGKGAKLAGGLLKDVLRKYGLEAGKHRIHFHYWKPSEQEIKSVGKTI